jgi:hypothetical protein
VPERACSNERVARLACVGMLFAALGGASAACTNPSSPGAVFTAVTGSWSGTYVASCDPPWQATCASPFSAPSPRQNVELLLREDVGTLSGLLMLKDYFAADIPVSGSRLPDGTIALSGDATTGSRCDNALHFTIVEWHVSADPSLSELWGSFVVEMTHNLSSCYYTRLVVRATQVVLVRGPKISEDDYGRQRGRSIETNKRRLH